MANELAGRTPAPYLLLAGGGSGGHVFPALAVGDELARRGWRLSFAGRPQGMERDLVTARGLDYVTLAARPIVGRSPVAKAAAAATLVVSALRARRFVRIHGVTAVLGTGGYASAPAVLGAALARRAALLVEPNARAGAANRWLSRHARAAALAYASAAGDLRCPTFVAGVPVREAFFSVSPLVAGAAPHLLVLGGSQGSATLNELVPAAVARLPRAGSGLRILHQAGAKHVEATRRSWADSGADAKVEVVAFLDDVAAALEASTLVVTRAGANALAELCAAGRPAVLVPLRLAAGHQEENARHLATAGAAWVLEESVDAAERLAALLTKRLADDTALVAAGESARALARPGAASTIADRVELEAGVAA